MNVMKAYIEGKEIQVKSVFDELWYDCIPNWDWDNYEYRVHPNSATPLDIK